MCRDQKGTLLRYSLPTINLPEFHEVSTPENCFSYPAQEQFVTPEKVREIITRFESSVPSTSRDVEEYLVLRRDDQPKTYQTAKRRLLVISTEGTQTEFDASVPSTSKTIDVEKLAVLRQEDVGETEISMEGTQDIYHSTPMTPNLLKELSEETTAMPDCNSRLSAAEELPENVLIRKRQYVGRKLMHPSATILAFCVILFVHVFLFPLYAVNPSHGSLKTYMDFEKSLCSSNYVKQKKVWRKQLCPRYGVVTTMQGGRLGNQMWEYASVWAVSRRTGLEPYIPRCIRIKLDQVFDSLTVPTFEEIAHCPVDMSKFVKSLDAWNYTYQSIVLPRYSVQPEIVLTWVQDIIQEFTFKNKLINKSQNILRLVAKNDNKRVFVGVHVRRTDYVGYLWRKYSALPANVSFYYSAMKFYEEKYQNVTFIIVSDDPTWCIKKFSRKSNVFITSKKVPNSPSLDLAILASCNHSIIDYGTFGVWGAILAGGETIFYNISHHSTVRLGQILPNWHTLS